MNGLSVAILIAPDGQDPYIVAANAADLMIYQQTSARRSLDDLDSVQGAYRLAWIAAKRHGRFAGSLAEFEASCDVASPSV